MFSSTARHWDPHRTQRRTSPLPLAAALAAAVWLAVTPVVTQSSEELFDPTAVQDLHFRMRPGAWTTLQARYLEDTYYRADLQWRETTIPIVGVRSRGSGSRDPRKPALKISFDEYLDQRAFGLKSLVLANGIQDPAMLKQRLGLLMFARMNMPSPRVVHARVFVNDEYIGLYQAIEPIDKRFLARAMSPDAEGNVEDEGYLYEYQWKEGFAFEYPGSELDPYAEIFEPETHEDDAPAELYGPLEQLFRTFNEVNDRQFVNQVGRWLDLRQFVRHLAVENFIAEIDGFLGGWGPNNFYLYRFQGRDVAQLLPWDKDVAFSDQHYNIFQNVSSNVLARRTLAQRQLYRAYLEALLACAAAAMEPVAADSPKGWLEAQVELMIGQIREFALADERKRYNNDEFEAELEKLRQFSRERGPYVIREARNALARMDEVR